MYAIFNTSTFPVLSPLPNNVPSTLSAPANIESSAAATPVPLSLCGWTLTITRSLSLKFLHIHSIWSAYTLGVSISTVDGKLIITLLSLLAPQVSQTASQISRAYSTSVPVKLSGEYSSITSPSNSFDISLTNLVPSIAIFLISSLLILNTTSLWSIDVELYIWTIALFNPFNDSNVFFIKCGLACVKTCTVTSSGIKLLSTNVLKKSYSIWDADGKPISISLNPKSTSNLNISNFSSTVIGFTKAWLPSRKSTEHQIGAFVIILSGHVLSFSFMVSNLLYFL